MTGVQSRGHRRAWPASSRWALDQPIETVSASGRFQRVSPVDVEQAVKQRVRNSGLVSVDLDAVRAAIEALPWVDTVSVSRAWPRGLHVEVVEQVAAARWGDERAAQHPRRTVRERRAPRSAGARAALGARTAPRTSSRSVISPRSGRLAEAGLRLTALRLDARGAWEMDLANGVSVRLGRRQVDERFERFVTTARQARRAAAERHRLHRHALHERICGGLARRGRAPRRTEGGRDG